MICLTMQFEPICDLRECTGAHRKLLAHLDSNWPENNSRIIAIDGLDGAGKTTIANFLAWQLGIAAISTDLFFSCSPNPELKYRDDEIEGILARRKELERVTIIEGILILKLLKRIGFEAEYLIQIEKRDHSTDLLSKKQLDAYYIEFQAQRLPDYNFRWERIGRPVTAEDFD